MLKREARELIYRELGSVLADTDFKLVKASEGFVRPIPGGWQEIGVAFYDYRTKFKFSLVMTIRIDAVQDVINEIRNTDPEVRPDTITSIVQPEYFTNKNVEYVVTSEDEIKRAVADVAPLIIEKLIPFLDQHTNIESLERGMNRTDPPIDTSLHPWRGERAVLLAKLVKNPDFDSLIQRYSNEMAGYPLDQQKFAQFVEFLKAKFPESKANV